jgi:hypothetical protein
MKRREDRIILIVRRPRRSKEKPAEHGQRSSGDHCAHCQVVDAKPQKKRKRKRSSKHLQAAYQQTQERPVPIQRKG